MPKDVVLAKTKKQYISDRDRKIFEMKFVQGMSYRTIAKEVGLSMAGTRKVFMRVVEQTRMEHMEDVMQLKAKGALVKQYIIAEAQKGYERSKQDKVKKVKKSGSTGKGEIDTEE